VDAVAFSPDGRLLASGAWDRTIRIWVIPGGDLVRTVRAPDPVYSVAWSPDGSLLAAGTAFGRGSIAPGTVSVWSAADMTPLWSRRSHGNGCYQVAFSPYGRSLASGGADGIARIWDARTGKMICTLDSGGINCTCVAFSPNGHELACGSARPVGEAISNEVVVWDVASARRTRTLTGAHGAIYTVAFSNDGHAIAAGGQDGAVELWSAP
jgi:WD40 repeat protein